VGLKNVLFEGAKFSEIHSNFLINENQATAKALEDLINLAIEKVENLFGIALGVEVKIIGEN
jgi:UDP-N-acetylmuramate dehydrogenase